MMFVGERGVYARSSESVRQPVLIRVPRWVRVHCARARRRPCRVGHDLAENGFPLSEKLARALASTKKIRKYPSTMRVYLPNEQQLPNPGDIFKNPDLARTLRKLVESEKSAAAKGRHEALKAARDRFYTGDIAKEMARFSEENGGLFRYEDFVEYTA